MSEHARKAQAPGEAQFYACKAQAPGVAQDHRTESGPVAASNWSWAPAPDMITLTRDHPRHTKRAFAALP